MRRHLPVVIVLLACCCAAGSVASQGRSQAAGSAHGTAAGRPDSIDNVIAGPLITVISQQLGGRAVDMRLDAVDVHDTSARDRVASGTGSLRIDGNADWVGFRFQVPYDAQSGRTGYPQVSMGGVATGERDVPNDAQLVQQLESMIVAMLSKEFRDRSVWLQLDRIATVEGGSHYLGISADGIAHVDGDSTDVTIEAFYDRSSGEWLRLNYGLGDVAGNPPWSLPIANR
jgi:hypothetical protein